jgi:hypothetical protein
VRSARGNSGFVHLEIVVSASGYALRETLAVEEQSDPLPQRGRPYRRAVYMTP